jgi:hypothetical protein
LSSHVAVRTPVAERFMLVQDWEKLWPPATTVARAARRRRDCIFGDGEGSRWIDTMKW